MSRPKAFDPDTALDRATELFRRKGYAATSVGDLVEHTGLSRSSLYDTFGDKHALFLAALDRYRLQGSSYLNDIVQSAESPMAGLRAYFDALAADCACPEQGRYGCLAVNAAAECAATDAETAARSAENWKAVSAAFAALVQSAQQAGELPTSRDAVQLGHFLTNAVYGLRSLQTAGAPAEAIRSVIDTTLAALSD
jgi:TetR/AcrR family transcriptional repressor of nem operon